MFLNLQSKLDNAANFASRAINTCKSHSKKIGATVSGGVLALSSGVANAIDTTTIGTALTNAGTDASTVGDMVIGLIAGIIVFGIVITLMRKA